MPKLPFKTLPKEFEKTIVGNADIGELEIPKYGDLSPNERIFIKENTVSIPDVRSSAVRLAKTIASKSGKKVIEIYNAIVTNDVEFLADSLEELLEFQKLSEESSRQRNLVMATAIIKFRLQPEWDFEDTSDANQIHPLLVDAIAQFARNEESGWVESESVEVTEEDLGNSTTDESQIGQKSTGESEDTGRKKKGSAKEDSETSQPG
ncbi:hypothetical protein ACE1AT_11045 [Pelatocladus sp. BLCC-F211]|uniref:hypothetical protein n=1 Tax=Pelatocladus sp. BLCC-F211 TaxID=3342752 RepID=UPI0035BAD674